MAPVWSGCVQIEAIRDELQELVMVFREDIRKKLREKVSSEKTIQAVLKNLNRAQRSVSGFTVGQAITDSAHKGVLTVCGTNFVEQRMRIVCSKNVHVQLWRPSSNDKKSIDAALHDKYGREFHIAVKSAVNWSNALSKKALDDALVARAKENRTKQTGTAHGYLLLQDEGPLRVTKKELPYGAGSNKQRVEYDVLTGQACWYFLSGGNPNLLVEMDNYIDTLTGFDVECSRIIEEGLYKHECGGAPRALTSGTVSWANWAHQPLNLAGSWSYKASRAILVSLMEPWWKP